MICGCTYMLASRATRQAYAPVLCTHVTIRVVRVVCAHVAVQVAAARQRLAAQRARVRSPRISRARRPRGGRVQAHVLVEVAGVAEGAQAVPAAQRLVAGVRADVDLQAVLARVQLAAIEAHVTVARAPPRRRQRLQLCGVGGWRRRERGDW